MGLKKRVKNLEEALKIALQRIEEQDKIIEKWDIYYQDCKNGQWGKLFWSLYPRFKKGFKIKGYVNRILKKINPENIKLVDKLEGTDPLEISEKIGGYLSLKTKLEQFKRLKEEYAPVYERKGGEDTL